MTRVAVIIAVGMQAMAQQATSRQEAFRIFSFRTDRYRVAYPSTWQICPEGSAGPEVLCLVRFSGSSRYNHGGILPRGAAEVLISAISSGSLPEDWMSEDLQDAQPLLVKRLRLSTGWESQQQSFTEVRWDQEIAPNAFQDTTALYFRIQGRPYRARLSFWKGDSLASQHMRDFTRIVTRITPVP